MRIGNKSPDGFITELQEINDKIQIKYLEKMTVCTRSVPLKVMLGDATITEQKTFDPALVSDYFKTITKKLQGWDIQDITITNNEDIRRIFAKYWIREGNYRISGHISIQFHVLLYYRPDHRVVDAQKELAGIIDISKDKESALAEHGEQLIITKLQELGYTDLDHEKLFEVFFKDDSLREKIYQQIHASSDSDFKKISKQKQDLFDELDSLLIETYQTSSLLIDDARLVTGEEGFLCTFDLEYIKDDIREGTFDPKKIPVKVKENIKNRLQEYQNFI